MDHIRLDEATSAIDIDSETQIVSALTQLRQGRATLVIAYRSSTIAHADRVVMLAHGRIMDQTLVPTPDKVNHG